MMLPTVYCTRFRHTMVVKFIFFYYDGFFFPFQPFLAARVLEIRRRTAVCDGQGPRDLAEPGGHRAAYEGSDDGGLGGDGEGVPGGNYIFPVGSC